MLTDNAIKVLERRYLAKDEDGNLIETVDDMFRRVARAVAQADLNYDEKADVKAAEDEFYSLMTDLEFMPNSPTLMNAGRPLGQLSACFVLPVEDAMDKIFDALKHAALIHKSGGGTGFSFSRLRPKGASVRSTGGVASGPVSFMKVFNAATEAVKQGGTRRGANMGILRVDHPDILEFIQCKKDLTQVTNFNISVGITEKFMQAVEAGESYELINPATAKAEGVLNAREVFDLIVEMAWQSGEPGIIFLDRLNRDNVLPKLGEIESTNPCGEQPLLPYESCNLGSINLNAVVDYSKDHEKFEINYAKLARIVGSAVHFLDNVIDINKYPLEEIADMTRCGRKIGLGVMGFADVLFKLGIAYGSEEATALAEKLMQFIQDQSKIASAELATVRGPFPMYPESTLAEQGICVRNATTTTIAPTGTISIICNASSGIEPLFAVSFIRNVMDNDELIEVHPYFEQVAKERGFYSAELMSRIAKEGTLHGMDEIPDDVKKVFVTAHDISPEAHIRMQAAFQRYTDNAVSKTVNFAHDATRQDVSDVYFMAFKMLCKGVTIYRDGSRDAQVLNVGSVNKAGAKETPAAVSEEGFADKSVTRKLTPRPRPTVTMGITEKVKIGCGTLFITVNYDEQGICEVFTNVGRAGGCPSQSEATSRLTSIALRSGVDPDSVIEQLKGIRCHSTLRQRGLKVLSCPDAIARVIEKVLKAQPFEAIEGNGNGNGQLLEADLPEPQDDQKHACLENCSLCSLQDICSNPQRQNGGVVLKDMMQASEAALYGPNHGWCPDCESKLEFEGGCVVCRNCGYSKCG
ncbi:MAG: vitamin B12-dependent ribonucleotide reductase [Christensenellales bacterium]|jgi:ribonucleoside-diphosphate reductase alpha chain